MKKSHEITIGEAKVTLVANQADLEFEFYRWTQVFVAGQCIGAVCSVEALDFTKWEYWHGGRSLDVFLSAAEAITALVKAHGGER